MRSYPHAYMRKSYCSDLSDDEWALVEPLLPPPRPRGRRPSADLREVLNAILYVLTQGCTWRSLPHDFPPRATVYAYFERWRDDATETRPSTFERIYRALHRRWRSQIGRQAEASAAVLDSQSVQTSELATESGSDMAKRTHGRKRHLMDDTEGFPLAVAVTPASVNDKAVARVFLSWASQACERLRLVWVDRGYAGEPLRHYGAERGIEVSVSGPRAEGRRGFVVEPRRWVAERSFAWVLRCRRLGRDVERLSRSVEAWLWLVFTRLLLRRITAHS